MGQTQNKSSANVAPSADRLYRYYFTAAKAAAIRLLRVQRNDRRNANSVWEGAISQCRACFAEETCGEWTFVLAPHGDDRKARSGEARTLHRLFGTVLFVVCVDGGHQGVVDNDFAFVGAVVEVFDDLFHGDDGAGFETVFLGDFIECTFFTLTSFHAVDADDKSENVDIALSLKDRKSFADGGPCGSHVFNDDNFVVVTDGTAEKNTFVAVVFDLFAVGAVADISIVFFRDCDGGGNRERNTFVGRSEKHIKIQSERLFDGLCIVFTEFAQLGAGAVESGIDEERSFASAFGDKITEL